MNYRSNFFPRWAALGLLILATAAAPQANAQGAREDAREQAVSTQHHGGNSSRKNELVKIVRTATAKYYNAPVAFAEADGFQLLFGCVSDDDKGAMGLHYVQLSRYMPAPGVFDAEIKADEPEILLYEPTPNGPRLTGADYLVDAATWDAANPAPPELNGQIFHYFGAPNRFRLPPFYTLHVWAWKESPSGTFVNWHDNVSCDAHN